MPNVVKQSCSYLSRTTWKVTSPDIRLSAVLNSFKHHHLRHQVRPQTRFDRFSRHHRFSLLSVSLNCLHEVHIHFTVDRLKSVNPSLPRATSGFHIRGRENIWTSKKQSRKYGLTSSRRIAVKWTWTSWKKLTTEKDADLCWFCESARHLKLIFVWLFVSKSA